jgi:HEAT repeat protein
MSGLDRESLDRALAQISAEDVVVQNEGVEAMIRIGPPAVPALLSFSEDERSAVRARVMYALSQIGVPEAVQTFQAGLQDSDEHVRAYAAQGLARLHHPLALDALLATLNDGADALHIDMTPSVQSLGEMGLAAAMRLLDNLTADDMTTRLHAQRALEIIVNKRYGFQPGRGFPDPAAEGQAASAWRDHGDYDYTAGGTARERAASRLRAWFDTLEEL